MQLMAWREEAGRWVGRLGRQVNDAGRWANGDGRQWVSWLGRGLIALGAGILGLLLGRTLVSPTTWTLPITYVGIGLHIMLILLNPVLGFLLWIITSPFGRFLYQVITMGSGVPDLTLDRIVVVFLFVLLLAQGAVGLRRWTRFGKVDTMNLIYVGLMGLSVGASMLSTMSAIQNWVDYYVVPFLVFILAKNLICNRNDLRSGLQAVIIVALYMAFLATNEQLTGTIWFQPPDRMVMYTQDVRRVVSLLGNPGFLALVMNMAAPFVAYLLVKARSRLRKLLYLLILLGLGVGVFMCYTRSGWVGFGLALLVMAVFSPQFRRYFIPALVAAGIIVAVAGTAILANPRIAQRLFAQGPIEYRVTTLNVVWAMWRDHFWSGVGLGNFPFYYSRYEYWDPLLRATPTPHNSYLFVAVTAGLPAAVAYVLVFVFFIYETVRLYLRAGEQTFPDRTMIAALWGAMASYLAASLVMDCILGIYPTMVLNLIMGMTLGAWQGHVLPPPGKGSGRDRQAVNGSLAPSGSGADGQAQFPSPLRGEG